MSEKNRTLLKLIWHIVSISMSVVAIVLLRKVKGDSYVSVYQGISAACKDFRAENV